MSARKEIKILHSLTRALISVLMILGFIYDGLQGNDPCFLSATLIWVYQTAIVRTESNVLRLFGARHLAHSAKD